jgi:hypothetical protein
MLPGVALIFVAGLVTAAPDPPDSGINPATGHIEITDSVWVGSDYDVRHVVNTACGRNRDILIVSDDPKDDRRPRILIEPAGDTWVTWWREGGSDVVLARKRSLATGSWSVERVVSLAAEGGRNPAIAHDGSRAWIAYEFGAVGERSIAVGIINDDPDPIGQRAVVATTDRDAALDLLVHAETGRLWLTWIDGDVEVGWSWYEAETETWSLPAYENYAADDVESARQRIRDAVAQE